MKPVMIKTEGKVAADHKFEVRAAPRRRAKGEEADDQPVFLRKAFAMISNCPPEIGMQTS
jgi:hypothetical protein